MPAGPSQRLEVLAETGTISTIGFLTAAALRAAVPAGGLGIGAVPHGFRSSFRDWAAECSDAPREVCELALAHVNSDRVEAAYRRTDLFERRRELMQEWSAFLDRVCHPPG